MAGRRAAGRSQAPVGEVVESLNIEELREVVSAAADRHEDVERAVRLIAGRADDDLAALRAQVDRGLRTRRFLPYAESSGWAHGARPIVEELRRRATSSPSGELVELLERAIGHVVKVIEHADDSDGTIGDLARELLELHATACDSRVADPVRLAGWMVRFWFVDQDLFEVDPVRYQHALGDSGLTAYRQAVAAREHEDTFSVRYVRERLAVLDGDTERIVALLGGDLTRPHQFVQVAEAMAELGREDDVLARCERGIADTQGWQTARLYDLACETHARRGESLEVLRLRRSQHLRMPSLSTYNRLRRAADAVDAWAVERDAARAVLRERDPRAFVDALLGDGDAQLAWDTAQATKDDELGSDLWLRLAESRETASPADAAAVYQRVADQVLEKTDRRAYAAAIRILKRARDAATAADDLQSFNRHIGRLREQQRRRPTMIGMLNKAGLR
jgi:hypothetical protein